jgi:hypothetical protein
MRRVFVLPCLIACLLALPAAAQARYITGFSENNPAMFDSPLYTALHTTIARYVLPWDFFDRPADKGVFDAWVAKARLAGVRPLVSFYISRVKPKKLPSPTQYDRMFRRFRAAYPDIKDISPWNEANAVRRGRFANPSARQAATFYKLVKRRCAGCKIVGLDVLDSTNVAATVIYIKQFQRALGRSNLPKIWGLHNYSDTNRFRNKGTKAVLAAVKGEVWLTETGGVVAFGRGFPYNLSRAARALKYMFKLAASNPRLKRLYIYQWFGAPPGWSFDAGVVDLDGTPRPGYDVVKAKLAP